MSAQPIEEEEETMGENSAVNTSIVKPVQNDPRLQLNSGVFQEFLTDQRQVNEDFLHAQQQVITQDKTPPKPRRSTFRGDGSGPFVQQHYESSRRESKIDLSIEKGPSYEPHISSIIYDSN